MANTISRKIREKQGEISDDETVRFKSYLMSLGIGDPVTRAAHGTNEAYHKQLAKEIFRILETPVQVKAHQNHTYFTLKIIPFWS